MRIYAGHQREDPRAAFFVFARSKQDAINFLAGEDIEVDEHSLKLVHDPGAFLFRTVRGAQSVEPEALRFDGDLPDWEDAA